MTGKGYNDRQMDQSEVREIIEDTLGKEDLDGKKVLLILPDLTRSAPVDLLYKVIYDRLQGRVKCLDGLIANGTHQPMPPDKIFERLGITRNEYASKYSAKSKFFNHEWDNPDALSCIGRISAQEVKHITGGLMEREVKVSVNSMIFDYDLLMVIGPVFPHEIVGFSGGNKYFFPGICGAEILDLFHLLGGLITNAVINGKKDTPVRDLINRSAEFIKVRRIYFNVVVNHGDLHGIYIGDAIDAWGKAAELSAKVNIKYTGKSYRKVLGITPTKYDEIWTAGKVAYKAETIVEDGGELIIYAPHISEISYTHGRYIEQAGYHVKDYFAHRLDKFLNISGTVLSHLIAVKGTGIYENGIEKPRINVVLATQIPKTKCRDVNLGYMDYNDIRVEEWENRENQGILVIHDAGEVLYKANEE
jgi:lactate racemase